MVVVLPFGPNQLHVNRAISLLTYRIDVGDNANVPRFRDIADGIFCCSGERRSTEPTTRLVE